MSKSETSARGAAIKKKQMVILAAGVGIFMVLALGATFIFTQNQPTTTAPEKAPAQISLVTGGSAYSEREAWRTQLGSDVAQMQKQFNELARQMAERDKARDETARKEAADRSRGDLSPPKQPGSAASAPLNDSGAAIVAPPPLNLPPPPQRRAANAAPLIQPGTFDPPGAIAGGSTSKETIATVTFDPPTKAGPSQAADGESGGMFQKQKAENYVPSGTFARIVVLNGLDAPTGGQSQANPSPVLLRIIDHATLPNGYKMDLKDCILTANGIGDVAAERANIRLDRMSCVDPQGGALDLQVRGYVAGEDGKAGMRGRLVTKTGQMLANALLASIGSGIGEAFKNASETTTTTPLGGVVTTTNAGDGFSKGFGQGTQRAFDMLARYYIQLAEKSFPIVEVDGGRVADIVFTRGFTLEGR